MVLQILNMILITGSLAYDQIMDFPGRFSDHILPDKLHLLNVSFLVNQLRKGFGGTAGNISYTLSLLGVKCRILGVAGGDFGPYREFLEKNEIDTTNIKTVDNFFTSVAYGITDSTDNQIWGFYTGADSISDQLSISNIEGIIDFGVIAPHNPKAMIKFAKEYERRKIPYLFDPGMQLPWLKGGDLKNAYKGAKIIIGNDYEISLMEKKTGIGDLHALSGENKVIITTLGGGGSRISGEGSSINIEPARPLSVSDPAGAGDAYRAGFLAGYLRKYPLKKCGRMGSLAAVYSVEKYGTTTHKFTINGFCKRYKENFGEDLSL